jgi:DNA-binding NtrC family response regulator
VLTLDSLPESLRTESLPADAPPAGVTDIAYLTTSLLRAGESEIYRRVCTEMDRIVLETVLRHVKANKVQASELLGISRTTLRAKLRALGMLDDKIPSQETDSSGDDSV